MRQVDGAGGMMRRRPARALVAASGLALVLAACGKKPVPAPAPPPPPPPVVQAPPPPPISVAPPKAPAERLANALALLGQGQPVPARAELVELLKQQPGDALATDLLRQIDVDPRILLGNRSYSYTIRRGETLSSIAGRLLGNRYRFYALARFNGITVPAAAEVGQTIQIPGVAPPPEPARAPVATAPVPPPPPAVVQRNPAEALRLRRQGLSDLARGSVDRAVTLLERALGLDPGNVAITADLARAKRVQSTLRGR